MFVFLVVPSSARRAPASALCGDEYSLLIAENCGVAFPCSPKVVKFGCKFLRTEKGLAYLLFCVSVAERN